MLQISGGLAIYRSGTEVLPAHQGRGLYGFFTSEVLKNAGAADQGDGNVLYGWRTRNPIVWAANAKICEKVTPSLLGDGQDLLCRRPASKCARRSTRASRSKCPA